MMDSSGYVKLVGRMWEAGVVVACASACSTPRGHTATAHVLMRGRAAGGLWLCAPADAEKPENVDLLWDARVHGARDHHEPGQLGRGQASPSAGALSHRQAPCSLARSLAQPAMHLHENHSQGHNASADLWALGILVYELLSGRYERGAGHRAPFRALRPCAYENRPPQRRRTPFASSDVMNTYNLILMGFG